MRVFLDPGHGGHDSGAVGAAAGKPPEKTLALEVARRLDTRLQLAGHVVSLSRNSDVFVELFDRAQKANTWGANLFISIHFNSADSNQATGIETFHYPGSAAGLTWAAKIQRALMTIFPNHKDRGVKSARFAVLKHTRMPAVLVECEFISNAEMHAICALPYVLDGFADAILAGVQGVSPDAVKEPRVCPTCNRPWT